MITFDDRTILHENLDQEIKDKTGLKIKQTIFISRHRSKSGKSSLTTHRIGNFGKAEYGGKDKTLSPTSPQMMAYLLKKLREKSEKQKLGYEVCFEVTYHRPYIRSPTFLLKGSTKKETMGSKKPAEVVADSIVEVLKKNRYEENFKTNKPNLVGIGGGHYAPCFTEMVFSNKTAFGQMIPSYQIKAGDIDAEIRKSQRSNT
ncbi:MAG: D-aminoacyl-tRNA deacylase [Candidatus Thermoplasmatota archaeon]